MDNDIFKKLEICRKNYINDLSGIANEIDRFTHPLNKKELERLAHNLKGSAGTFHLTSISEAAEKLETAMQEEKTTNAEIENLTNYLKLLIEKTSKI